LTKFWGSRKYKIKRITTAPTTTAEKAMLAAIIAPLDSPPLSDLLTFAVAELVDDNDDVADDMVVVGGMVLLVRRVDEESEVRMEGAAEVLDRVVPSAVVVLF
jgi:hypothetical protein